MTENLIATLSAVAVVAALVGGVVGLLERNHRRTAGVQRPPGDLDRDRDRDLARTLDDLRAATAYACDRGDARETAAPGAHGRPTHPVHRVRAV